MHCVLYLQFRLANCKEPLKRCTSPLGATQPRVGGVGAREELSTPPLDVKEFENGGLALKTHQMFSVLITMDEVKNTTVTAHLGFMFEKNSVREVT